MYIMSKTMSYTLRMPAELVQLLDAMAIRDKRSRSQLVVMACEMLVGGQIPQQPASIIERAKDHARASHDPKTCRIYGCLLCKEMDA